MATIKDLINLALDEVGYLEKKNADSIALKLKYFAEINKLSLQLKDQ